MWNVLRKTANITLDIPNWVLAIDEHLLAPIHQAMRAVSPWQWLRKTVTANTTDRWCGYVNCRISWKSQRSCWFVMRYCMCAHLVSAKKEIKYLECLSATQQHSSHLSHMLSLHYHCTPNTPQSRTVQGNDISFLIGKWQAPRFQETFVRPFSPHFTTLRITN